MDDVVRVSSVSKSYELGSMALDGVSLTVGRAEAVAVTGPSGSGKSTLLNMVGGLDRPDSGTVEVAGQDLTRLSETAMARFRRHHIGIVFQFFNLLDDLTARDNILLPAQLGHLKKRAAGARADELLEALGIAQRANAYPGQLSGGERQRVAVARALINKPVLLLADEPTGAVDRPTGRYVAELFADIAVAGQTLLLVTHDLDLAARCTTREVVVTDGRVRTAELEAPLEAQP
jgi:putative ABC transport system ATP-binding protein